MIVWSGWGLLVIVFALFGFFLGTAAAKEIVSLFLLPLGAQANLIFLIGGALSAAMIYFFAAWREATPARVFVDEMSGERLEVRASAGSLFLIPMRWWAWIILILCAVITYTGDAQTFDVPP